MMNEQDELLDEYLSIGDARRCPIHPGVKTSSDDGMFDAPCDRCEGEMDEAADAWDRDPANPRRSYCGASSPIGNPAYLDLVGCDDTADSDEIPF